MKSNAIYKVVDLLCEGEIEGLIDGQKSIYLDQTPLQADDDAYNFADVSVDLRTGQAWGTQTHMPDYNYVENEVSVNAQLTWDPGNPEWVARTISDTDVSRVRLTVTLPEGLWFFSDAKGKYRANSVSVSVQGRQSGGSWQDLDTTSFVFEGRTLSAYQRSAEVDLGPLGAGPWDIRLGRLKIDEDGETDKKSATYWAGYTEIKTIKLVYPDWAVAGITMSAKDMGGRIVQRLYRIRGRKISVPDVYYPRIDAGYVDADTLTAAGDLTAVFKAGAVFAADCGADGFMACEVASSAYAAGTGLTTVELIGGSDDLTDNLAAATRLYTGDVWAGTFHERWCDNNAWIYYDLQHNSRFGAAIPAAAIDKWTLYTIAQYNDVLVADGFGRQEPRFRFWGVIQTRADALQVLGQVAASMRAMPYYATALATLSQDRPLDATRTFGNADVTGGEFIYEGPGRQQIRTAALITWYHPDNLNEPNTIAYENFDAVARYGYNEGQIMALGAPSYGQAFRQGRFEIDTECAQPDTVRFVAGAKAADLQPGEIFAVADKYASGTRRGVRIVSASGATVVIDDALDISGAGAGDYSLITELRDGDGSATLETEIITAADIQPNGSTELTLAGAYSSDPAANTSAAVHFADDAQGQLRYFRTLMVSEQNPVSYAVYGIQYDGDKYDAIEGGYDLSGLVDGQITRVIARIAAPADVTVSEHPYAEGQSGLIGLDISWSPVIDERVDYYRVQIAMVGADADSPGWWEDIGTLAVPFVTATDIEAGDYIIRVRAESISGTYSPWSDEAEYTVTLDADPPADITGLQVKGGGGDWGQIDCEIEWTAAAADDQVDYYKVEIYTAADALLRTEYPTAAFYNYSLAKNGQDNAGAPMAVVKFKVYAHSRWGVYSATAAALTATHTSPTAVSSLVASAITGGVAFTWDANADAAFSYFAYRVKVGAALNGEGWLRTQDPYFFKNPTAAERTTYGATPAVYFEVRAVDRFGQQTAVAAIDTTAGIYNIKTADIIDLTLSLNINDATFGNQGIQLDYNAGAPRVYVGNGTDQFLKFDGIRLTWKAANTELDADGNLTASNATLAGQITATAGAIGGWTLAATTLTSGGITLDSGNTRVKAANGANYVEISPSGIVGSDSVLGTTINIPTDGSPPTFSSGVIDNTIFKVYTSGVIRTADDPTATGGLLINNTRLAGYDDTPTKLLEFIYSGSDKGDAYIGDYDNSNHGIKYDHSAGTLSIRGAINIINPGDIDTSALNNDAGWDVTPPLPSDENLVGYWSFDDGNGTVAVDSSGNGNNGTLANMEEADWDPGVSGTALTFGGTNESVNCGDVTTTTSSLTISLWIKSAAQTNVAILDKSNWTTANSEFLIYINASGNIICSVLGTGAGGVSENTGYLDSAWHHIVAVFEAGVSLRLYVDTVLKSTDATIGDYETSTTDVVIGANSAQNNRFFVGSIDEVRLYDSALTADEIRALYLSPGGSKSPIPGADITADQFANAIATIDSQTDRAELGFDTNGNLITSVLPTSAVGTPGSNGLFLGSDKLGFFTGGAWRTYMDNSGNFALGTKLQFDYAAGLLSLNGSIDITGVSTVRQLLQLDSSGSMRSNLSGVYPYLEFSNDGLQLKDADDGGTIGTAVVGTDIVGFGATVWLMNSTYYIPWMETKEPKNSSGNDMPSFRLFNRSADPAGGSYQDGDICVVNGVLKIYNSGWTVVGSQS